MRCLPICTGNYQLLWLRHRVRVDYVDTNAALRIDGAADRQVADILAEPAFSGILCTVADIVVSKQKTTHVPAREV